MESIYFIVEIIIAAVFVGLTLALSGKFMQAGVKNWGLMMTGFILIFLGAGAQIAFSVEAFAHLFVPSVKSSVSFVSHIFRICGLLTILSSFYWSVVKLYRTKQQEQAHQDSFKLLDIIRDTVNQSLSLIELLNFSVRELVNGTASDAGCVFIHNPNRDQLVLAAQRDLPRELEKRFDQLDDSASIFYRSHKNSQPYMVGNISNSDKETARLFEGTSFKSMLAVPLVGRSGSFGLAVLFSTMPFYYSREQTQVILSAANIMGPAVSTFRMEREIRDISQKYKTLRKSEQLLNVLLDFVSATDDVELGLQKINQEISDYLGVNAIAVYTLKASNLERVYPVGDSASTPDELSEQIRKSIIREKSLLVRTESEGSIEKFLIIPSASKTHAKQAVVMDLKADSPDLSPEDIEQVRLLAAIITLRFGTTVTTNDSPAGMDLGKIQIEDLNSINNILTGILGNAQLLGVNLKKENLRDKTRAIHSLDTIIEETFGAGQIVRNLQDQIQKPDRVQSSTTTLESVLLSLVGADASGKHSNFYLRHKPALRFDLVSSQNGMVDLNSEDVRAVLLKIFTWLEYKWTPKSDLSVKLIQSEQGMHFVISETLLGSVTIRVNDYKYSPLNILLGTKLSDSLMEKLPVKYYYNDDKDLGRFLVIRFPGDNKTETPENKPETKPKILAIDDQQVIRELLSSMLAELKYPHLICEDGLSGVKAFEEGDFDILITDLGLPDIDGWQVAERIRKLKPEIPVIVITGWGMEALAGNTHDDLADYILPKPFRMEQLGEIILAAQATVPYQT